jgi:hypothetical protein
MLTAKQPGADLMQFFYLLGLASLAFLTACGSLAPPTDLTGADQSELVARMGQPDMQRQMPGGITRLEFPGGPLGRQTWFVDLDATGRVLRSEQVLTEKNFSQIIPAMAQAQVRQRLGRPGEVYTLARGRGVVWSYRYENPFCQWFQVEIAADQMVRSAGYGEPPECGRSNEIIVPN